MAQTFFKHRFKIASFVFVITLLSFYVNYVFIFQTPLVLENHLGFLLYSFVFSVVFFLYANFKAKVATGIFFVGWVMTLVNLYIDLLKARIETGGTVGATLGFLSNMILVFALSIILELFAQVISRITKR
ncbi:MAG: hypothetical protein KGZ84_06180 [Erysipelotrichia bacterium]|jgi:hypothetical protein|nr:hypothetical protein [Erysipelotrichia bacterium]